MARIIGLVFAGLLCAAPARSADAPAAPPLAGNWKFIAGLVSESGRPFYLLKFEVKDGKWTGSVLDRGQVERGEMTQRMAPATLKSLSVSKDLLRFDLQMGERNFQFEGRLPRDRESNLLGTISLNGNLSPAYLEPTSVSSLEPFVVYKEILAHKSSSSSKVLVAALGLLQVAAKNKAKPTEVRSWADRAVKAADAYGPRWQRNIILRIAENLSEQKGYDAIALQYARKAERLLENKDPLTVQVPVLKALATALEKSGKPAEAKDVQARIQKLVQIKAKTFAGRKGKSARVVLAELFTCSGLTLCSAAGLALNTLETNFRPKEIVFLEYHLSFQDAVDPLLSPAAMSRAEFYGLIRPQGVLVPILMLDGKAGPNVRGDEIESQKRYDEIRKALILRLEEAASAKIAGSATRKANKIEVKLDATDVTAKAENLHLRAVLVEDKVEYKGGDGVPVHHNVVCAFVGGSQGEKIKSKKASLTATVDLDKVKKDTKSFLEKGLGENAPKKLPTDYKKLRVIAFVQDDDNSQVLQAVQIDVK
jgi:hypothetical protein